MKGERTTNPESLVARYGIGRRLATRIVALLARKLDVTPTVLEAAAADEALARLLLSRELLAGSAAATEESLHEQAARLECADADLLRLVDGPEGWRTLALEDDLLASEAQGNGEDAGVESMGLVRVASREISLRGTEELFTPAEVARLKLSVLTSQDPDERTEAIRKLVFAPVDGGQKASILLTVLVDREAELRVRREAIRALEQIGFRSDLADAVRGLFEDDPQQMTYAVQRLTALLQEAQEAEAALCLAVVLEVLDQSSGLTTVRQLLRLVARSAQLLIRDTGRTEQFLQCALRHLARDFEQLRIDVEDAVLACTRQAPGMVEGLMWQELDRNEDASVRSLLLHLCETVMQDDSRADALAERVVSEILNPALPESEKARLRYGLVRLGESAVQVGLDRIAKASPIERSELTRLLDVLCTEGEVSDEAVQCVVVALVDLLKLADPGTRRTIVEAVVLGDPRVPSALQRSVAGELLALMGELNLTDTLDAIQRTLERIGFPALTPCFECVRRSYPSEAAQRAALALARIISDCGDRVPDDLVEDVLALCSGLLDDERVEKGAFVVTLAAASGYTRKGASQFDATLQRLQDSVWQVPYPVEMLDALGILAGSANAQERHQKELFELFRAIVSFRPRGTMGRVRETQEGLSYEFGREIVFDTRVVPAAVKGLERIVVSAQATGDMRTDIAKKLLVLWEGVSKVRIVWGPTAVEALVSAMCSAACSPGASTLAQVRLGASLLRFLNKISVIRSIGEICSSPSPSDEMQDLAVEAGEALLDEWAECDRQDDERRLALLLSAGRVAANPALEAPDPSVVRLRERALHALFSGLREGLQAVREPLLLMRECPGLSAEQRTDIDVRLAKAFGLVPGTATG